MRSRIASLSLIFAVSVAVVGPSSAADISCNGLVPGGQTMVCPGFEPNWAVSLSCKGSGMTADFTDAFSGDGIVTTPGTVSFSSSDPWTFTTSHGVAGTIAYTPGGCQDEGDNTHDFTFTPTAAPGVPGPFFPFCCRFD